MKTKIIVFAAAAVCACLLTAVAGLCLNPKASRAMRWQWEETVGDARTVVAAVRYLATPELPARTSLPPAADSNATGPDIPAPLFTGPIKTEPTNSPT